jgi:hypothetical protein
MNWKKWWVLTAVRRKITRFTIFGVTLPRRGHRFFLSLSVTTMVKSLATLYKVLLLQKILEIEMSSGTLRPSCTWATISLRTSSEIIFATLGKIKKHQIKRLKMKKTNFSL